MPAPARPGGMGHRLPRSVALCLAAAVSACGFVGPTGDLVAVPTQPAGLPFGLEAGCPAALLEGTLVADEKFGFVVEFDDALIPPTVVAWPHGWVARDAAGVRELLDGGGRVRARSGDRISAGGGWFPPEEWFHPCGEITFAPAA